MIDNLSDRNKTILKEVIRSFIAEAEPVASVKISKQKNIDLSPATVRSAMSELETLGFLMHPHTSAGRIPTVKGYRFFLGCIKGERSLTRREQAEIESMFSEKMGLDQALHGTSKLLSSLSRQMSIVMTPTFSKIVFRHIKFMRIGKSRLLALMVSRTGMVINKVFEIEEPVSERELEKINNYLNGLLEGLNIAEVKARIFKEMSQDKTLYDLMLSKALKLGAEFMKDQPEEDVYIEGRANILDQPEFCDIESMKRLFRAFEKKSLLLRFLDECIKSKSLNVFIDDESGVKEMSGLSLVVSPYGRENCPLGCIAVLGPTRMDYSRVIPIVEYTALKLNSIIREV